MKYIKLFEDYESSAKQYALKQAKKELNPYTEVGSGYAAQKVEPNEKHEPNEEEVKKAIARNKSVETLRSWHPKVYDWLVKNNKLDWIKHLPKRSTAPIKYSDLWDEKH